MKTLFIDTHNEMITIILFENKKIINKLEKESCMQHSVYTMPMIEEILKKAKITPSDLNEIIVVNGPGSFTGVRIGVTIAKTMAYLLNIPIKSIDMLEAKACLIEEDNKIVIEDEKNGKYIGIFNKNTKEYIYLKNSEFEDFKKKNKISIINELDYEKILNYLDSKNSINPHAINPLYIKKIEVLK